MVKLNLPIPDGDPEELFRVEKTNKYMTSKKAKKFVRKALKTLERISADAERDNSYSMISWDFNAVKKENDDEKCLGFCRGAGIEFRSSFLTLNWELVKLLKKTSYPCRMDIGLYINGYYSRKYENINLKEPFSKH